MAGQGASSFRRGLKQVRLAARARARRATWPLRGPPDVLILGAMKAGTTSLAHYFSQHPQLCPAFKKEVHFFDGGNDPEVDTYDLGERWYRAQFPLRAQVPTDALLFEASPLYLFSPLAPARIRDMVPNARLIALLRHPTDRAISHVRHEQRLGTETLDLPDALAAEERRLAPSLRDRDYTSYEYLHFSYKHRGHYDEQLARYLELFPDRQIMALEAEDLFNEPGATLRRVFEFLEVDADGTVGDLTAQNVAPRTPDVEPGVREHLDDYFAPHIDNLSELLGDDLGW